MKPLIEFYEKNKDNKNLVSKEHIFKKKGLFSLDIYTSVYLKGISDFGVSEENTLFGINPNKLDSLHFCEDFFILTNSMKHKKLDYRVFRELTVIPRKFGVKGSGQWRHKDTFLLNHHGIEPQNNDFYLLFNEIKSIINTIEFDDSMDVERMTQTRKSVSMLGFNELERFKEFGVNELERFKEKEMDPWEIKEIQEKFSLEIVDLNNLTTLLSESEKEILEKEKGQEYLQKFIRLKRYISQIREGLLTDLIMGKEDHWMFKSQLTQHLNKLKTNNEQLELLNNISYYLISNFVNNKMIDFYEMYETLDQLGIFNSNYENRMIEELGSINDGLRKINNKLTYLNMVTTYNTFQLRSIRKGLKE